MPKTEMRSGKPVRWLSFCAALVAGLHEAANEDAVVFPSAATDRVVGSRWAVGYPVEAAVAV